MVVLDGPGAHRTEKVRELLEERGADLVFLPSYSPEMNPIEEAFSNIKHLVRKAREKAPSQPHNLNTTTPAQRRRSTHSVRSTTSSTKKAKYTLCAEWTMIDIHVLL